VQTSVKAGITVLFSHSGISVDDLSDYAILGFPIMAFTIALCTPYPYWIVMQCFHPKITNVLLFQDLLFPFQEFCKT